METAPILGGDEGGTQVLLGRTEGVPGGQPGENIGWDVAAHQAGVQQSRLRVQHLRDPR